MSKLRAFAGCLLLLGAGSAAAGDLFTNGVIYLAPAHLDFGSVLAGETATNTFLLENLGRAKLEGQILVPAPFKVLGSTNYTLRVREAQVVTITYTPTGAEADTETVKVTGGGGVEAIVTGRLAIPTTKKPKRKLRAGPIQN